MADPAPQSSATSQTTPNTVADPEIVAIGKVNEALASLEPAVQQRVLRWAAEKFGVPLVKIRKPPGSMAEDTGDEDVGNGSEDAAGFADFASLYEAAKPKTDAERALVAGYWLQVIQRNADWDGFSANKELKHLGHGISNITWALDQLINQKPQLVMQTRKSGKARQARKKYKMTGEGVKRVNRMFAGTAAEGSDNGGQE